MSEQSDHYKREDTLEWLWGPLFFPCCSIVGMTMSMDSQLPTPPHHEGTRDSSKMNMNDEMCSVWKSPEGIIRRSFEGLIRKIQGLGSTTE